MLIPQPPSEGRAEKTERERKGGTNKTNTITNLDRVFVPTIFRKKRPMVRKDDRIDRRLSVERSIINDDDANPSSVRFGSIEIRVSSF